MHRIITVPSIVPLFTPHKPTAAETHFLFLCRPLAAPVPGVPFSIKIVVTVAAATAATVSAIASATFSALIVANLSPSSSDRFSHASLVDSSTVV